jgi:hypothetical protein
LIKKEKKPAKLTDRSLHEGTGSVPGKILSEQSRCC